MKLEDIEVKRKDEAVGNITVLEVVVIFLNNRRKIYLFTALVFILTVILYFFVFDLIYFSSATIKSTGKGNSILSALEGGIPDLGGLDELGVGSSKSAKELAGYEEILNSRRCLEELIIKFDLMNRLQYAFMEDAIKDFRSNIMVLKQEKLSGVLSIGIFDKDPVLAKEMVEFLLYQLNKINIEISVQTAKNNREFIEQRYIQAKEELANVEDSLKSFQMIYGVAPDLQIKASAQSVFQLEAELKAEEVKLDVLKSILGAGEPEVLTQVAKVNALKSKIGQISTSSDLDDFIRLGNSPIIATQYVRLVRDVEINTKILTFVLPLYEQAKIEEKRETPTIMVLDKPYVAEKKVKPKRLTMVLALTFVSFLVFWALFVILEKWKMFKKNILSSMK